MKVLILAGTATDITKLITDLSWSGDTTQAARRLEVKFLQSTVDANIVLVRLDTGYTVQFFDDENILRFQGNVTELERDRSKSTVKFTAYDNIWILNKSKATRKFTDALPEDIARSICAEMGVKVGNIISTNQPVSFIANNKTGYQIIHEAFTEAGKLTNKKYQVLMRGDVLDVIEGGELCGFIADSAANMTDSIYKKSIQNLINAVRIVDSESNTLEVVADSDSINQYSMIQAIYREAKDKDSLAEARAILHPPDQEGTLSVVPGDFSLQAGYSLIVRDENFSGRFQIKSDTHHFQNGVHSVKLSLEFEKLNSQA